MTTLKVKLGTLLNQVCEARKASSTAAFIKLEEDLITNRILIINLLDDKPKKAEHEATLKSGKAKINGTEYRVNEEFIKQAMFISHHLNLDEFESARLLLEGISQAPTVNSTALETAVYLYHLEREYILTILNDILEASKDVNVERTIRSVFARFMADIIKETTPSGDSFIGKIIKSTKELSVMISTLSKFGMLESGNAVAKEQDEARTKIQATQHHHQLFDHNLLPPPDSNQFSPETTKLRIDHLTEERISLVKILYHIASLYWLPEEDLLAVLIKVRSINLSDNAAAYLLTTLLAALSYENANKREGIDFSTNDALLKKYHDQITSEEWKVDTLKAVVSIQWALFISIISSDRPGVEQALSFDRNARTEFVRSAVALDAFGFMNNYLLYFKQKLNTSEDKKKTITDVNDSDSAMALDGFTVDPNDYTKFNVEINDDFKPLLEHELEILTQTFIFHMSDIIRALKTRISGEMITEIIDDNTKEEIHNTLTKLLTLLASIYRDRRDAGLKFWNAENTENTGIDLPSFLAFMVDFKFTLNYPAVYDFLGAISTGPDSAIFSYSKLKIGTNEENIANSTVFSWGKLFSALQFYSERLQNTNTEELPAVFSPEEEDALCKFLYLCQQVVQYSATARKDIWASPILHAHRSIIEMISCPTSTRFRATLYDLLAAFSSNWGGGVQDVGKEIAHNVWNTLENSNMFIPEKVMVRQAPEAAATTPAVPLIIPNTLFNGFNVPQQQVIPAAPPTAPMPPQQYYLLGQTAGFLGEFEEEKSTRVYTETLSVLNLLVSLIHAPSRRDELVKGFAFIKSSVPPLLGNEKNRTPGTAPYISLVVDHIFLNLKTLEYLYPDTQWHLTDACLAIIENSLMSFNIEPLCDYVRYTATHGSPADTIIQNGLLNLVTQPGYDVLVRILSGAALIHELFKIVENGKGVIAQSKSEKNTHFVKSITSCLRIFSKVFKIQNDFVNLMIPQLNASSTAEPMGNFRLGNYVFPSPPYLRSLGNLMLYNTTVIVQIALLVNCDDYQDICALSASILSDLSSTPEYNANLVKFPNHINTPMGGIGSQLAGILLSDPQAASIIFSFSERLEVESAEITTFDDYEYDMNTIPFWLAQKTLDNIYRYDDFHDEYHHSWSLRIIIMDMLLKNVAQEVKSPTVTEFLLGYDVKDLELHGVQQNSIPSDVQHRSQLVCLLSILDMVRPGTGNGDDEEEQPLIQSHPILAEKCYQLLFKLCARDSTSTATLHYLRNNCQDFFVNQFRAISSRLETNLHVAEPYFEGELESADKTTVQTDFFTMVSVLNQRAWLLKLVALELRKTAHTAQSSGTLTLLQLLYGISDYETGGALGNEEELIRQMEMKLQLDSGYQQPLWNLLEIVNSLEFTWKDILDAGTPVLSVYFKGLDEKKYVIEKEGYSIYNIREIYKILRRHEVTNNVCRSLPENERLEMQKEMCYILQRLMAENRHREIAHGRLHCFHAWKQVVEITISDCFDLFTFETREKIIYDLLSVLLPKLENENGFHVDILNGLGEMILSLLTRLRKDKLKQVILQVAPGDHTRIATQYRFPDEKLRAVFISIVKCICKAKATIEVRSSMYSALVNLLQYINPDGTQQDDTLSAKIRALVVGLMRGENEGNFLDIICGDASDGLDVYKTTAYMALEALYVLVSKNKSTVNSYLVKKNFLQYTISMIKRASPELTKIIQNRDASFVPLYNHEAKISLLLQIALKTEGADLLLSNGIIKNIDGCEFINTRCGRHQRRDIENGYKIDRHRRLLKPILELVVALLSSTSSEITDVTNFETWVKHQDVLVYILKDENTEITLSSLYILQLTTSLLYQLTKSHYYFMDLEKRGLAEHDSLLMHLLSKYCVTRDWASMIIPTNLVEEIWATQPVPETMNGQQGSLLAAKADKYIADIRNNLLSYAQASTFRPSGLDGKSTFKPVFANTLEPASNSLSRASSSTPSLTTLVSCLAYTGKKLTTVIADYEHLCQQKENVQSLKYEESVEIANTAIPKGLNIKFDSLNPTQQFQVLTTEINQRLKLKLKEIQDLFIAIENTVFILWRHLEFYLKRSFIFIAPSISPAERHPDETVVLLQQALFQTSPYVIERLKSACRAVLDPVIDSLEKIPSSSHPNTTLPQMYKRLRKCYN